MLRVAVWVIDGRLLVSAVRRRCVVRVGVVALLVLAMHPWLSRLPVWVVHMRVEVTRWRRSIRVRRWVSGARALALARVVRCR